jgi:hypothetical protein
MLMEAMRLSLIEHEQQQQRQREEEERNRRNGETGGRGRSTEPGNSASLSASLPGQRSSSVVPPESVEERVDHRPSSSVPNNNVLDGLHTDGSWRMNPSRLMTLGAGLNAVAIPLSSSTTQTGGTDEDTATISSESSGTGRSSTRPTPDAVEGGVDYTTLPSSPESQGQPSSFPTRSGDDEAITGSTSRTFE